jgi:sugar/nucleoside kinase (ribokinase family)
MRSAVFVGLSVVDVIHAVEAVPRENAKAIARRQEVLCGGPAANAAITCAFLGGTVTLASAVGQHPLTNIIRADLAQYRVSLHDLTPSSSETPSISSVLVTEGSGARAIISGHATRQQAPPESFDADLLNDAGVLLIDGHQSNCAIRAASIAKQRGIPVVLDGGSWKPQTADLLAHTTHALCSDDFHPPGTGSATEAIADLLNRGVQAAAITRGGSSILWATPDDRGEIALPKISAIDTSGAGDIFHGAFCHRLLRGAPLPDALAFAAKVASFSCQYFGTRAWIRAWDKAF